MVLLPAVGVPPPVESEIALETVLAGLAIATARSGYPDAVITPVFGSFQINY
jgi:hypothetical protein